MDTFKGLIIVGIGLIITIPSTIYNALHQPTIMSSSLEFTVSSLPPPPIETIFIIIGMMVMVIGASISLYYYMGDDKND